MYYKLRNDLIRRDESVTQFYYKSIGLVIKKRRLELDLTQEYVSKGICSNTYLSKIENNQIDVNEENLHLIMERINLPKESISFPNEMKDILYRSLEYFFFKDIEKYEELFEEMKKYRYGILIFIARMGYYIITENFDKAKKTHDDMYHYLTSLEDYGFSVFLIYSCFYNIGIGDFVQAKKLAESVEKTISNNQIFLGLIAFAKFLIYGNIYQFNKSRDSLNICTGIFVNTENIRRINDLFVWKNIFAIYEDLSSNIKFSSYKLETLQPFERNMYLVALSIKSDNPKKYISYFDKSNWLYQLGLYFIAKKHLLKGNSDTYQDLLNEIQERSITVESPIDLVNMLKLQEQNLLIQFKDYLINSVLPYCYCKQNIFFMNRVTKIIVSILSQNKRYKDSMTYVNKNNDRIELIQK